ncbi:tRNA lysidine(34) synthetase TilS [Psychromarinibacter halotolerans]|uniref:tRNA(Ile)-lysidine synthase n=1 Tax=Psychromarinibacter halotolerans TaxID=1775175 RepID=A0ABV7GQZ6_9RHOB|nr:tRNA lysidine(34) synthetase TilS [Psychromarinibacter halotolerans]MDF0597291.1 tRNA lysidine(34) synthetase TilS [Psychromarinibacter halotolerans]
MAVAVSGGGDSLALLHLLHDHGLAAAALTVDHGLRPEAADEARMVARICGELGLRHAVLQWRWDGEGNLSEAAREGRYSALADWCRDAGIGACALGHTRDDNIESFFMGLSRGAGLDGLCGMRPAFDRDGVRFHRPLLDASRESLRDVLHDRGVGWAEDPTNADTTYDRARIRAALATLDLPDGQIAQSIGNLAATRRDIGEELLHILTGHWRTDGPDIVIDLGAWTALTAEFRRRTLAAALRFHTAARHAPRAAAMMRIVARDWTGDPGPATLAGCTIGADGETIRIGREAAAVPPAVSTRETWDNRWTVEGTHSPDTVIRALGEAGVALLDPGWKSGTLPRRAMLAAPSVWRGDVLVHCPFGPLADPRAQEAWTCTSADDSQRFTAALRSA